MIEFLLHRYGSLSEIYKMPFMDFIQFYKIAKEKETRSELYQAWVVCLPNMTKDNFISFEEYYDKCTGRNIDTRPKEEILAEAENIRRKVKENGNITF